jgi:hypothetical protein
MTNSPHKVQALTEAGIMVERVPLEITPNTSNVYYLHTKHQRLGHMLTPLYTALDIDDILQRKDNCSHGIPTHTTTCHKS